MRGNRRTARWRPRLAEPVEGMSRHLGEGWQALSTNGGQRRSSPERVSPQAVGDTSTDIEIISALEKASCFSLCKDSLGSPRERRFEYRGAAVVLQNTFVEFRGPPARGCHHRSQSADVRTDGQEEALAFSRYLNTFHWNWTSHPSQTLSQLKALDWCPSLIQQPGEGNWRSSSLASSRQRSPRDRTCSSRGSAHGSATSPVAAPELEGGVLLPTPSATPPQSVFSTPRRDSSTGATPHSVATLTSCRPVASEGDSTVDAGVTTEVLATRPKEPLQRRSLPSPSRASLPDAPRPQRGSSAWRPTLRHLCPEASEDAQPTGTMQRSGDRQRNSKPAGLMP